MMVVVTFGLKAHNERQLSSDVQLEAHQCSALRSFSVSRPWRSVALALSAVQPVIIDLTRWAPPNITDVGQEDTRRLLV